MNTLLQLCIRYDAIMYTDICKKTSEYIIQVKVPMYNLAVRKHIKLEDLPYIPLIEENIIKELQTHIDLKKEATK